MRTFTCSSTFLYAINVRLTHSHGEAGERAGGAGSAADRNPAAATLPELAPDKGVDILRLCWPFLLAICMRKWFIGLYLGQQLLLALITVCSTIAIRDKERSHLFLVLQTPSKSFRHCSFPRAVNSVRKIFTDRTLASSGYNYFILWGRGDRVYDFVTSLACCDKITV
jgi:hypothetical protein